MCPAQACLKSAKFFEDKMTCALEREKPAFAQAQAALVSAAARAFEVRAAWEVEKKLTKPPPPPAKKPPSEILLNFANAHKDPPE